MGALVTKIRKRKSSKAKGKEEPRNQVRFPVGDGADDDNGHESVEGSLTKRKTLKELQLESPPGFKKFEIEVNLETIDEEIALQLWEDVFKPLYTF